MLSVQIFNGFVLGCIYVLASLGFTLVFGMARIINFAHGELLMIGAFITYLLTAVLHLNVIVSIIAAMLIMFVVGALIERAVFRPFSKRDMTATLLASSGLMIILRNLAHLIWGTYPRMIQTGINGVLNVGSITISYQRLFILLFTAALVIGLYLFLYRTKTGKAIRAVSQDKDGAAYIGININSIRLIVLGISSLIATGGGASLGILFSVEPNMGFAPLMKAFAVVILGGLGSIPGAVIGGLAIGIMESLVTAYLSASLKDIFPFILMIVILVIRPKGLFGKGEA